MKNKIAKRIFVFLVVLTLALPGITMAQWSLDDVADSGLPGETSIKDLIFDIMNWLLAILAAVAIIAFVIAGIMYLLSGGDDTRMKTAKNAMIAAIIGVVVGIMGLVIIYAVENFLLAEGTF